MKTTVMAALASLAMATSPANAQENAGKLQVKILGTAVLPDGKIDNVNVNLAGLPANIQTKANDNGVPTLAIEYFLTDNISLETICCMTQHDVDGTTGLPGAELVSNAKLIPATLTAKYHFDLSGVKPYVGAGATNFWWVDVNRGAATIPLGVTKTTMSDELGLVLQAGADIPVNDNGLALTVDAKRYFVDTTARWFAGNTLAIKTKHKLDPWVLSAGLAWRF